VVQDSLAKAWTTRRRVRDPEKFPAWSATIARHRAHDILRKRQPFSYPHEGIPENEAIDTTAVDQKLHSALATLPELHRAVLTLPYFEEMNYRSKRLCATPVPHGRPDR
jgi:RNA polymerase sigma-70 factor (ECF subfamily)